MASMVSTVKGFCFIFSVMRLSLTDTSFKALSDFESLTVNLVFASFITISLASNPKYFITNVNGKLFVVFKTN